MESFRYQEANSIEAAISASASQASGKFLAGGTTLIDLMKLDVETPHLIVDVNRLPLAQVESTSDGGVRIGAMVRNSDLANHELIK
jgi:xanthine dehydrogenase YagS FAD-binding subunit